MKSNNKGFSLIELMIVVGIIGIIATIAMPKFQTFQARAKISEAKVMLNHIATLEEAYSLENNAYVGFGNNTTWYGFNPATGALLCDAASTPANATTIGFTLEPCDARTPRFAYNINAPTNLTFFATANSGRNAFNRVNPAVASAPHKVHINQQRLFVDNWCNTISGAGAGCADDNAR